MTQKTVRQVKTEFQHYVQVDHDKYSDLQRNFWHKLNQLGWNKRTKEPEECQDVDATAFLTDEEYQRLAAEYTAL